MSQEAILQQLPAWLVTIVAVISAVIAVVKAAKKGDMSGVVTALSMLTTTVGSKAIRKVKVARESLDIVYQELSSGTISDNGIAVIQDVINKIVTAYGDDPEVQNVVTSILSTLLAWTPKTTLKRAYKQNALQVLAVIETFAEPVDTETVA